MIDLLIYSTVFELGLLAGMVATRCWCERKLKVLVQERDDADTMAEVMEISACRAMIDRQALAIRLADSERIAAAMEDRATRAEVALAAERGSYV